jgi:hypothetical protein
VTLRGFLGFAIGLNFYEAIFAEQWYQRLPCACVLAYYALRGLPEAP